MSIRNGFRMPRRLATTIALSFAAFFIAAPTSGFAQLSDLLRDARERLEQEARQELEEVRQELEEATGEESGTAEPANTGTSPASAPQVQTSSSIGAAGIAGEWIGAFQSGGSFIQIGLNLSSPDADGFAEASVRLEPAPGEPTGIGNPMGVTDAVVGYDDAARTVTINFGFDARSVGMQIAQMRGYVDTARAIIAGVIVDAPIGSSPYFILARPADAGAVVFDNLPSTMQSPGPMPNVPAGEEFDRATLERWASRFLDEYPDVDAYHTQIGPLRNLLRNLFADDHFSAHFGTTYDRMSDELRSRVFATIRTVRAPRANFPEERVNGVLLAAQNHFLHMPSRRSDFEFSVLAKRYVDGWKRQAVDRVSSIDASAGTFDMADAIESAAAFLAPHDWPSQSAAFLDSLQQSTTRLAGPTLEAEVDSLIARASGVTGAREINAALAIRTDIAEPTLPGNASATAALLRLSMPGLATASAARTEPTALERIASLARSAPDTWASLQPRLDSKLDELLQGIFDSAAAELGIGGGSGGDPRQRLRNGRRWYDDNRSLIIDFAGRRPTSAFVDTFASDRERSYRTAMPALLAELERAGTRQDALGLGNDLYIGLDGSRSASWQDFARRRDERAATIDREAFAARVGEGPFGVDHPGAVYLNALYRNDLAILEEEDQAVIQPLASLMIRYLSGTGFDQLAPLLSGGMLEAGSFSEMVAEEARRYSIAQPLAGFFIIAYERIYPRCMDSPPAVIEHTVVWETVVRNGFGTELYSYPSGSTTTEYRINRRHVPVFERVGLREDAEQIDFNTSLFGAFLPSDVTEPLRNVSETLRGLRMAMTEHACDSAVIRRLERNMIERVLSK